MRRYDFHCCPCDRTVEFSTYEDNKFCQRCKKQMHRVFAPPQVIVHYSAAEYVERAIEGKETVPGFSAEEIRKTVAATPKSR